MDAPQISDAPLILIVEDDVGVRELLHREFSELEPPLRIASAETALDALEVLAREKVAVVVTDIRMPGMDGVELTRRIKGLDANIEVILVTGHASVQSAAEAVRLGAFDYLTKPFDDLDSLGQRLLAALAQREQRLAAAREHRALAAQSRSLAHLTDALPMGVLLLDGSGRPSLSNRAGQEIVRARDALLLDGSGRLAARDATTDTQLQLMIQRCVRDGCGDTLVVPRLPTGAPLSLLFAGLPENDSVDGHTPMIAVLISDPTRNLATTETVIGGLYGLTPAEARLSAELMQGKNLETAALSLGISAHTARTHLKHVFSKTRTGRQGELISLLLSGPASLALGRLDGEES